MLPYSYHGPSRGSLVEESCVLDGSTCNSRISGVVLGFSPFCSQPPVLFRCFCYTLQRVSERSIPVSSLQQIQKKQRANEVIKTISTNNDSKFCTRLLKQGLPSEMLPYTYHGRCRGSLVEQSCLLDGFTCNSRISGVLLGSCWTGSLCVANRFLNRKGRGRDDDASVTRSTEAPNISIPFSSLQHIQKKQRAIKTISTNNGSKFCSRLLKQGFHPKRFPILNTAHAGAALWKRAASWMASLAAQESRESY
ncbi:hypothetical protein CDAR_165721 [Caerostris darwini]|uniref:Uncharacterized protein n=1 Tax=Caerostris darwini TaxID=1538125 RepID=A0AAV4W853_9ARAC|nr:hypothetical protein CDAR_165721 [Caerostris darwini]